MDGILIVNKPKKYTSHDIVYKVKKISNEKVGHTGTLDPNATGVLPLLIGKGTLISKYLINHDKIYEAVLKLGIKTDTADVEGNIVEQKEVKEKCLNEENIKNVFKQMIGKQEQIPPMYSAIKVKGKKLYEYAREGETVQLTPRIIEIYDINLKKIEENEITFSVFCSKGTYIRTLCETIANKLETVGYMKELKRVQVGEFNIEEAINVDESITIKDIQNHIISIEKFFENKEKIILNEKELNYFLNGVKLTKKEVDGIYRIYNSQNLFIGLATIENNKLKRDVIL